MDKRTKILLIEDNPNDLLSIQKMLSAIKQFDLRHAGSLSDGLKYLSENKIDVILLDLNLPDSSGFETFAKVSTVAEDLPIIVVSGLRDEDLALRILKEGGQDYLIKEELTSHMLKRAISYGIERKEAQGELRRYRHQLMKLIDERTAELREEIACRKRIEEELQGTLKKLRNALNGIIQAMTLTVETKDPYTAGHQRRVANLARAIAQEMNLPEEKVDGIRIAGILHDIGKIYIPAEILNKPSKLSEIEFSLIKTHVELGYDILKEIKFPAPVDQIVRQHHERMDGSGYPQGLKGEDILIEARILGVADVVEAMAARRPYREALGINKALEEIIEKRGTLYDPEVVDACVKLFVEKNFTLTKSPTTNLTTNK